MEGRKSSQDSDSLGVNKQSIAKTKQRMSARTRATELELKTFFLQTQADTMALQATLVKKCVEVMGENNQLKQHNNSLAQEMRIREERRELEYLRVIAGTGIPTRQMLGYSPQFGVINPPHIFLSNNLGANTVFARQIQLQQRPQMPVPQQVHAHAHAHAQARTQTLIAETQVEDGPSASSNTTKKSASAVEAHYASVAKE